MKYQDALRFVQECENFGSRPGLERMQALMDVLGNPQDRLSVIHVAGTNGKGSVCAMLSYVLCAHEYKTGLYISPGTDSPRQRIQLNNTYIAQDDFASAAQKVKDACEEIMRQGYEHPTEFEIFTAMAFLYFDAQHLDFAVIETGMGGRLDATNVIKAPKVCVITNIAYDHMQYLGDTIESIAREKAGIIKPGCDVVLYDMTFPQAKTVIKQIAKEKQCRIYETVQTDIAPIRQALSAQMLWYKKQASQLNVHTFTLGLIGDHQIQNVHCVFNTLEALYAQGYKMYQTPILLGLKSVKIPYRFEIYHENPFVVLDGAHNVNGMESLVANLKKFFPGKKPVFFFGMLQDKQVLQCAKLISSVAGAVYTLDVPNARSMDKDALAAVVQGCKKKLEVHAIASLDEINTVLNVSSKDALYVFTGSLYSQHAFRTALDALFSVDV